MCGEVSPQTHACCSDARRESCAFCFDVVIIFQQTGNLQRLLVERCSQSHSPSCLCLFFLMVRASKQSLSLSARSLKGNSMPIASRCRSRATPTQGTSSQTFFLRTALGPNSAEGMQQRNSRINDVPPSHVQLLACGYHCTLAFGVKTLMAS